MKKRTTNIPHGEVGGGVCRSRSGGNVAKTCRYLLYMCRHLRLAYLYKSRWRCSYAQNEGDTLVDKGTSIIYICTLSRSSLAFPDASTAS
jgi:hypothetical protein